MQSIALQIAGTVKSHIRCRSFARLKIHLIEKDHTESKQILSALPAYAQKDFISPHVQEKKDWENIFIELNTITPNTNLILRAFEREKEEIEEICNVFLDKISALLADPTLPKRYKQIIHGNTIEGEDYTDLPTAKSMHNDYCNQLIFIKECINELKPEE